MLKGKKTYITGGISIIGAWAAYATGALDLSTALQATETALLAIFIRGGVGSAIGT